MNSDDIFKLAREADARADAELCPGEFHPDKADVRDVIFAALIIAEKNKEIETYKRLYEERGNALARPCIECGHVPAAIRARGEK